MCVCVCVRVCVCVCAQAHVTAQACIFVLLTACPSPSASHHVLCGLQGYLHQIEVPAAVDVRKQGVRACCTVRGRGRVGASLLHHLQNAAEVGNGHVDVCVSPWTVDHYLHRHRTRSSFIRIRTR